ncbi:MAG: MobV family relaxase [Pyrinomonadaceae bacterium]
MPLYGTIGIAKQKGGSVASSGHHNDRSRETLNADPNRLDQNRILIGDERNVREIVTQIIDEHGGKPRRDSVEAVEIVLSATRAYFTGGRDEIDKKRLDKWIEQSVKFLKDPKVFGKCAKAVLHLDEQTPHIHAHQVPIDDKGKLNCKHYIGHKNDLYALHDLYHQYMEPLGLERGRHRSFAKHTEVRKFYAAIMEQHEVRINHDRIPDPPRIPTKARIDKYKDEVVRAVLEEIREPLRVVHHQAMLTREETAEREAAELRAAERIQQAEYSAQLRVTVAEKAAEMAIKQLDGWAAAHEALKGRRDVLEASNNKLIEEVRNTRSLLVEKTVLADTLSERLRDIPMPDVMEALDYGREQIRTTFVYRNEERQVALMVHDNHLLNSQRQVICRNSVDLVMYMMTEEQNTPTSRKQALEILADHFGEGRAMAAGLVCAEQSLISNFIEPRNERMREQIMAERAPSQDMGRDDHNDHVFTR